MPDWRAVRGWFDDGDARALATLLLRLPLKSRTAHVGILCGRHLASVADVLAGRQLSVLAVDTWEGSPPPQREADDWPAIVAEYMRTLADFRIDRVHTCKMSSAQAAAAFSGERFGLVFIDAAHDYDSIRADILAWKPLLTPGGVLCGHDFSEGWPGVVEAVNELLPGYAVFPRSSVWYWRATS